MAGLPAPGRFPPIFFRIAFFTSVRLRLIGYAIKPAASRPRRVFLYVHFMCTLRIVILRTVNRLRTAPTVRLSLSAIIVGLFPASTISRNCLSSSGSQRRSLALLVLIPPTVKRWLLAEARRGLHARNHRCRPRYLQRRYARRCSDSCRCTPNGSYRMRSWRSVLDTA